MSYEFDVDDVLICINADGYEEKLTVGQEYVVISIWQHNGEPQPRVAGRNTMWDADGFLASRFVPKEEEMPILEPTMYREEVIPGAENRLHVIDAKEYDKILLIMENRANDVVVRASMLNLDADEALNLASDLTRMAMQLKRRTK